MKTANRALEQLPDDAAVVAGTRLVVGAVGEGQGREGALSINVIGDPAAVRATRPALEAVVARLADEQGFMAGRIEQFTPTMLSAVAPVTVDPESERATGALVRRARAVAAESGIDPSMVAVGGISAFQSDLNDAVGGSLLRVVVVISILSYLVLLVLLRSVILPLKAVALNLLSVAAAYGVVVIVFQWGWLDWTGFDSLGHLNTLNPSLILAITFGLSMDYEVFLLSRIREVYRAHGDGARAIAEGVADSARLITSAAAIMVLVFAGFALTGVVTVKEIGVGLAVAIAIDATIVRLVLVPATMGVLGDWNWWLPGWLDRVLPRV